MSPVSKAAFADSLWSDGVSTEILCDLLSCSKPHGMWAMKHLSKNLYSKPVKNEEHWCPVRFHHKQVAKCIRHWCSSFETVSVGFYVYSSVDGVKGLVTDVCLSPGSFCWNCCAYCIAFPDSGGIGTPARLILEPTSDGLHMSACGRNYRNKNCVCISMGKHRSRVFHSVGGSQIFRTKCWGQYLYHRLTKQNLNYLLRNLLSSFFFQRDQNERNTMCETWTYCGR